MKYMRQILTRLSLCWLAARLTAVLACLLVLPGCLTTMLWEGESTMVSEMVLLGEEVEQTTGSLELADTGLVFGSSDGVEYSLKPLGSKGEPITALLLESDHCEVVAAELERLLVVCDAQILETDSSLEIRVRLRPNVLVESVPDLNVDPSLRTWMVNHLLSNPVGSYRAKVVLEEVSEKLSRRSGDDKIQAQFVQRLTRYKRVEVEEDSMSVWAKIAFTPITLSLDLVLSVFWAWLSDEIDGEDEDARSGVTFSDHSPVVERK